MRLVAGEKRVLEQFYARPHAELTAAEVGHGASLSHERVHSYLNGFATRALVAERKIGKANVYRVNLGNEVLLKYFELLELERKRLFFRKSPALLHRLEAFVGGVSGDGSVLAAILFGSAARADSVPSSDIDLLLVVPGSAPKAAIGRRVLKASRDYSLSYGKQLNALAVTLGQFEEGCRGGKGFYTNLWRDRIVIYGESLFWKVMAGCGGGWMR